MKKKKRKKREIPAGHKVIVLKRTKGLQRLYRKVKEIRTTFVDADDIMRGISFQENRSRYLLAVPEKFGRKKRNMDSLRDKFSWHAGRYGNDQEFLDELRTGGFISNATYYR
ncbi:MAG: hypothetical protein JRJ62_11920, partial [Deltaproteobacteria bacterium]|nr:hypothetical protein [Deltaproteobacteria bacterium]